MRQVLFLVMIWVSVISVGCTSSIDTTNHEPPPPGTPTVTSEQAKEIAMNVYKIKEIDTINSRKLEQAELEESPVSAYGYSPVYWIIKGKNDEGTVYISLLNPEHHFKISN